MRMMPPQASSEGQRVVGEFRVLLESVACHHADSSKDKRHPEASSFWSPNARAVTSAHREGTQAGAGARGGCQPSHQPIITASS
jgi:hypothetical protein